MTSEQKKILLTGLGVGLFLKGSWHRIDPNKVDNEWPVEFSWSGIRENPAFRASITTNPFYKISDLTVTAAELKALAITAEGSELTLTASSEKEGYSMGMFYNATEDTTITILCITDLDTANERGGFNAPATGLYVRYTADPDGAKYSVKKTEATETALYLYGTPSESGNVAVRSGDAVTVYDGAVLPKLPEWDEAVYPYDYLDTQGNHYLQLSTVPFKRITDANGYQNMICDANGSVIRYIKRLGRDEWERDFDGDREVTPSDGIKHWPFVEIYWANFDILNNDGTTHVIATDPIPVSGIVEYLYNGMPFPEIPVIEGKPNVCIVKSSGGNYMLFASGSPFYVTGEVGKEQINWVNPTEQWRCDDSSGQWEHYYTWTGNTAHAGLYDPPFVWSNHEINKDGNLWLSASEPIPIYE